MNSIIQKSKRCIVRGCPNNDLHLHHIFYGTANRRVSDKNGFVCWLCGDHHNLSDKGIHFNKDMDLALKKACQRKYEETHTREEFMALIGRNYLED